MYHRQRVQHKRNAIDNSLGSSAEDADPNEDAAKVCQRKAAPASAQLRLLIFEEEAAGNVWDEGNAKLQHPAIN